MWLLRLMTVDGYFPAGGAGAGPGFEEAEAMEGVQQGAGPPQEQGQEVLSGCLVKFGSSDFIMEPEIFSQLKKYFQAGGNPEQVIALLSANVNQLRHPFNSIKRVFSP